MKTVRLEYSNEIEDRRVWTADLCPRCNQDASRDVLVGDGCTKIICKCGAVWETDDGLLFILKEA